MSCKQIKDVRPAEFKRYCGLRPETFQGLGVEALRLSAGRANRVAGRDGSDQHGRQVNVARDNEVG